MAGQSPIMYVHIFHLYIYIYDQWMNGLAGKETNEICKCHSKARKKTIQDCRANP